MAGETVAFLGFAVLFLLLFIRMPVGLSMMLVGTVGIYLIRAKAAVPTLAAEIFGEAANFPLMIIPLFVLMGNLAGVSRMSRDLYDAANSWLGHLRIVRLFAGRRADHGPCLAAGDAALQI
jgi:TRAP-type mannitol/chloroaromatic compound transport system permease large subunit